jgi:hypothetical protein
MTLINSYMRTTQVDKKGRLGPGQMIALDLETGQFYENFEVNLQIASSLRPHTVVA